MSVFGICPNNACIQQNVYSNPRCTVYFQDFPPELGVISNITHYNILGAVLRRGEFSPSYDGPPAAPAGTGWRGFSHLPLIWDGPETEFKIEFNIVVGRQQFQQVDAELFVEVNGIVINGLSTSSSLSRAPSGFHGTTTMNLVGYLTLQTGDTITPLLKRIGFNEASNTNINIYSATVNISSLKNKKLSIDIFT